MNNNNNSSDIVNHDDSLETMLVANYNLRANIKLSLLIYKGLNNFEHEYIHHLINDKSKDTKPKNI